MKLVIIGAPGAGKGTQSKFIIDKYKLAYIATGEMLREEIKANSAIGKEVASILENGGLVPGDLMVSIVKERLGKDDCKNGFLLDGFPRTKFQVDELEKIVGKLDRAIHMAVPDDVIINRVTGRETCPKCNAVFNKKTFPSKVAGICDICGTELISRNDDSLEKVTIRLAIYKEETEPLLNYFKEKGILLTINGNKDSMLIKDEIVQALSNK